MTWQALDGSGDDIGVVAALGVYWALLRLLGLIPGAVFTTAEAEEEVGTASPHAAELFELAAADNTGVRDLDSAELLQALGRTGSPGLQRNSHESRRR